MPDDDDPAQLIEDCENRESRLNDWEASVLNVAQEQALAEVFR